MLKMSKVLWKVKGIFSPGVVEQGLSVRTTGGDGDRRVTRSLRKCSNMEKHGAVDHWEDRSKVNRRYWIGYGWNGASHLPG